MIALTVATALQRLSEVSKAGVKLVVSDQGLVLKAGRCKPFLVGYVDSIGSLVDSAVVGSALNRAYPVDTQEIMIILGVRGD